MSLEFTRNYHPRNLFGGENMAEIKSVNELLNMELDIPDYQRPYKWDIQNIDDLLSDITNAISDADRYRIPTKLAEIRNPFGSGHGKSASYQGLEIRHAKLAVGSSITFVDFIWSTYESTKP